MREKTVCFTGHRIIPRSDEEVISRRLEYTLISSIENGYRYFGVGGAVGFDMMAEEMVLRLKRYYPAIRLILVLPCKSHDKYWNSIDRGRFERILSCADKVVYISQNYTPDCTFRRNRHLVDNSSLCICYLTKYTGGTAYTVNYAKKNGCRVINLAEE